MEVSDDRGGGRKRIRVQCGRLLDRGTARIGTQGGIVELGVINVRKITRKYAGIGEKE